MKKIEIRSLEELENFASILAKHLDQERNLIVLSGDLGAGKTTFTKYLGKALGVKKTINSPTFTILKSYTMGNGGKLHHIDAYRLENIAQDLGFEEIFDDASAICVVEWFQFIEEYLPKQRLEIHISIKEDKRVFTLTAFGDAYEQLLEVM